MTGDFFSTFPLFHWTDNAGWGLNTAMPSSNQPQHDDPFGPPKEPIAVFCLHCGEEFESWQIVWKPRPNEFGEATDSMQGDWCCPTDGCDGVGFGFDIFPCDKDWRDDNGEKWFFSDDGEEDFDFDGVVDNAVIDQFWREDPTALRPDSAPDELSIDTEGLEDHPLKRLLPPEELPTHLPFREDDIPF